MADLAYLSGAILGYLGLSYILRWSFLSFVKSWKGYPYAMAIMTITGPVSSGIGGADGGPFNLSAMIIQGIIGLVLTVAVSAICFKRRYSYEYVSNGWVLGGLIWALSILIFGGLILLNITTVINNPNL